MDVTRSADVDTRPSRHLPAERRRRTHCEVRAVMRRRAIIARHDALPASVARPIELALKAPTGSNAAPDSARIDYNRLMPMIGFRQGSVDIFIGYTKFNQRGKSNAAIFVGTVVSTEFPVSGRRGSTLIVPLMFAADYTKAESGGPERDNFNIASLGLGAGLSYRLSTDVLDFSIRAGELFQYATEGLSVGSGFSAATVADASLVLHEVVLNGLALGYRFRYQTWSMSEARFNYKTVSHGPYLGILF